MFFIEELADSVFDRADPENDEYYFYFDWNIERNIKMANRKITTTEFRVSFPNVFEAKAFEEGAVAKYSLVMLFPKATDLSEMKKLAHEAMLYKWPDPNKRPKVLRSPFRDGNEMEYEGYADHVFITASGKNPPGVIDGRKKTLTTDEEFYAGCYARATVVAYPYDFKGNRGVAFGLHNVQKLRDGEPFSGKTSADNDFDATESGEEYTDFQDAPAGNAQQAQPEPNETVEQAPNWM